MRIFGTILFLAGLTYAAWFAAYVPSAEERDALSDASALAVWWQSAGLRFVGGLALMIGGGVIARLSSKSKGEETESDDGTDRKGAPPSSAELVLSTIATQLAALPAATESSAEEISEVLNHILNSDVPAFLEFKDALVEEQGLEHYAEVISHFAVMERGVARAWSALTDQVYGEVAISVNKALGSIEDARAQLAPPSA